MATFNFDDALKQLQSGKPLTGLDGILTPLIKQLTEAALQAELDQHLAQQRQSDESSTTNRKNGYTRKTIKAPSGNFELDTPRDREGSFEPQLVKKHQTRLTDEIDHQRSTAISLTNQVGLLDITLRQPGLADHGQLRVMQFGIVTAEV